MMSWPLLAMSKVAEFHVNFNFIISVLCVTPSDILTIPSPGMSSMNGASTLITFCCLGFRTVHSFREIGRDLLKKLKQQSCIFVTPSNSNTFFIPKTKSTYS